MKKILIANRGEIAVRIIRACKDYGVKAVAIYADDDFGAMHTRLADEAFSLEGKAAADTYLNANKIIEIAQKCGADAIHPGYGFLAENADFAQQVIDAGLIWIGPNPKTIATLGDKIMARQIALKVGAPLIAGTDAPVKNISEVYDFAQKHGLPIIIKAAFGGGGRGMKIVRNFDELESSYLAAEREALAAFGRSACFVEQFLENPRHIEAQVIADSFGKIVVLGTRDCSLQRRNQKLIEEAPAPFLTPEQTAQICTAAHNICQVANYVGAGTVEFLLSKNGQLSFLEVNTRLQVEHPVTEQITGFDLVLEQLRISDGLPLSINQMPPILGHSFEFRINAEDIGRGFLPSSGVLTQFDAPNGIGVRLDAGVQNGDLVSANFDSLIAKLIVSAPTRTEALARAKRALAEFKIKGVASILDFHQAVLKSPDFTAQNGFNVHTNWLETDFTLKFTAQTRPGPNLQENLIRTNIELDGKLHQIGLPSILLTCFEQLNFAPKIIPNTKDNEVLAPISGNLYAWQVQDGDFVKKDQPIAIMEAMKMEVSVNAPKDGILQIKTPAGSSLNADDLLAIILDN